MDTAMERDRFSTEDILTNPEEANARIQAALEPTGVDVEPPPRADFELPAGFYRPDGKLVRDAVVRELNGEDEETLAKANVRRNPGKFVTLLLERGVVSIGGEAPNQLLLNSLFIGDRDFLVLAIRRTTFGDTMEMDTTCPNPACKTPVKIAIDLSTEVPNRRLEETERQWTVPLRRGSALVTLPTGFAQEEMFSSSRSTVPEMNTALLVSCVKEVNGEGVIDPSPIKKLGVADRNKILEFINEKTPGPDYSNLKMPCDECGQEFPIAVSVEDLFRG